jgi:hypothetical protein
MEKRRRQSLKENIIKGEKSEGMEGARDGRLRLKRNRGEEKDGDNWRKEVKGCRGG